LVALERVSEENEEGAALLEWAHDVNPGRHTKKKNGAVPGKKFLCRCPEVEKIKAQ